MNPPNTIKLHLKQQDVSYEVIPHQPATTIEGTAEAANISLSQLVRTIVLNDIEGVIMLLIPANHLVDFSKLRARFGHTLELTPINEVADLFIDYKARSIPPLTEYYGLPAFIDNKIFEMEEVYFQSGARDALLRVNGDDFRTLNANAQWGDFSRPSSELSSKENHDFIQPEVGKAGHSIRDLLPSDDIKKRIEKVRQLPAMPEMGSRLLQLKNNPNSTAEDLAEIIALDPSLSAQVIRYARSAFFGYRGEIDTIKDAIIRVLGFDMVMNMAMGLALGKNFSIPIKGPLGLKAFWRHAIFSATLCQALCTLMPASIRPKPDLAYLVGLLHNFGYLLMGHLLKPEFYLLNKTVAANPEVPVALIEKRLLGVSHTQIGAWLMAAWNMPAEVTVTMAEHHNECYQGDHDNYVHLVFLVDCLLKARNLGDAADIAAPTATLNTLGLDQEQVETLVRQILQDKTELDTIAQQLVH